MERDSGHSDKRCLNSVLSTVAQRTGEQIKYSKLDNNYTIPTIKKAFELLETASLFSKVRAESPAGITLGANTSGKKFKIEVKSGKSGRLTSLHLLMESFPNVKTAYVFTEDKYGELPEKGIKLLPLFNSGSI